MRRQSGMNVSSKAPPHRPLTPSRTTDNPRGRSQSPNGLRDWRTAKSAFDCTDAEKQDTAILQSMMGEDIKIRQGKTLLKPSEIRNRTPGKKVQKDWGECPLTFDAIKEPVRAMDGKVYEKWAIEKWLAENNNRSPLTNVVIDPTLTPLSENDEGTVRGERFVAPEMTSPAPPDSTGIKTQINTVLNAVRYLLHQRHALLQLFFI
jgi:hypothetical protein